MAFVFSKEQQKIIDARDCNVLVSAAAGSGKTTVLVQRILGLIKDKENPINVDELLVVTFTKAAAAEMKDRLMKVLMDELEADPDNEHLERQATLIHNAMITTIDGFCNAFLKEHFYMLDLEPGFRVMEENELNTLKSDIVDEVLNHFYEEGTEEFVDFIEQYVEGNEDSGLKDFILELYRCASSSPFPMRYLDDVLMGYEDSDSSVLEEIIYFKLIFDNAMTTVNEAYSMMINAVKAVQDYRELDTLQDYYNDKLIAIEACTKAKSLRELSECLHNVAWERTPTKRNLGDDAVYAKDMGNGLKDSAKKIIEGLKKKYFYQSMDNYYQEFVELSRPVKVLVDMTKMFMQRFSEEKISKNAIDFADMEHLTLSLLYDENNERTAIAKAYESRYKAIMIDEYQDSNMLQEYILNGISSNNSGIPNMFMVGDVKQSIYGFRQAEPGLFLDKYNTYKKDDDVNTKIVLDQNYRSRPEVLNFANAIFKDLMREDMGGLDYDDDASLKRGSNIYIDDNKNYITELLVADCSDKEQIVSKDDIEGRMVVMTIKDILDNGMIVDNETKELRPARPGDIAILVRKNKMVQHYTNVLGEYGIRASAVVKNEFFDRYEIKITLSLLKVIDNDRQDIPLTAVLLSPIGGLSDEDIAKVKIKYKDEAFYKAVRRYVEEVADDSVSLKIKAFYELLNELRDYSKIYSIHELIRYIYKRTSLYEIFAMYPNGNERCYNLDYLLEYGKNYEATSYHGLFSFLHFLDCMEDSSIEGQGAENGLDDEVKIMTIHKSKGLEYPYVILAGAHKQIENKSRKKIIVPHKDYGLGMLYANRDSRTKHASVSLNAINMIKGIEDRAEEIRILYVALTRAKEKLIVTAAMDKVEERIDDAAQAYDDNGALYYSYRMDKNSYLELMLPTISRELEHHSGVVDCRIFTPKEIEDSLTKAEAVEAYDHALYIKSLEDIMDMATMTEADNALLRGEYRYAGDMELKIKMSVSDIKHRFMEQYYESENAEDTPSLEEVTKVPDFLNEGKETYRPAFLNGDSVNEPTVNKGALRGTAVHRVLECIDFAEEWCNHATLDDVTNAIRDLFNRGLINEDMYNLVSHRKIMGFITSTVGQEVVAAAKQNKLYKEQPFVISITPQMAGIVDDNGEPLNTDEEILVQGIIDVYYETQDGIVLLDYKTDKINSGEELVNRYRKQMELYSEAIMRHTGKSIKQIVLYSFSLMEEVIVDLEV